MSVSNKQFISERNNPQAASGYMDACEKILFHSYGSNNSTPKVIKHNLNRSIQLGELGATSGLLRDWLVHINIFVVCKYAKIKMEF